MSTEAGPAAAEPDILNVNEVAALLRVSRDTVDRERAAGRFPKPDFTVGTALRWRRRTIERWIEAGGSRPRRGKGG